MLVAMSIVFIGTPDFAVPSLRRLAAAGHTISAVITQPDRPAGRGRHLAPPPVKLAAEELGLPVLQPETLRDAEALDAIRALQPEVIVAVAYGQILRQELLDIAPRGVLNVHPSLLPRHRGASPIAGAILAGDEQTGVSIMLMDAGMDTGPVLAQLRIPFRPDYTTEWLTGQLAHLGADLLAETLPRWLGGQIKPRPQDDSQATVTHLIRKEDGAIDWTLPAIEIWRRVRAYNPWPGASTTLDGEALRIWQAQPLNEKSDAPPGTIVATPPGIPPKDVGYDLPAFAVQTGDTLLGVQVVQPANRRRMTAWSFANGRPGLIGKRLG
jgi:methionyl-tRNA formyltransferase